MNEPRAYHDFIENVVRCTIDACAWVVRVEREPLYGDIGLAADGYRQLLHDESEHSLRSAGGPEVRCDGRDLVRASLHGDRIRETS